MIEIILNNECYFCFSPELHIEELKYKNCDGRSCVDTYVTCWKKEECDKNLKKS